MGRAKDDVIRLPCPIEGCSGRIDTSSVGNLKRHFTYKHPESTTDSYVWPPEGIETGMEVFVSNDFITI
jgi:hypothetical protein